MKGIVRRVIALKSEDKNQKMTIYFHISSSCGFAFFGLKILQTRSNYHGAQGEFALDASVDDLIQFLT